MPDENSDCSKNGTVDFLEKIHEGSYGHFGGTDFHDFSKFRSGGGQKNYFPPPGDNLLGRELKKMIKNT